ECRLRGRPVAERDSEQRERNRPGGERDDEAQPLRRRQLGVPGRSRHTEEEPAARGREYQRRGHPSREPRTEAYGQRSEVGLPWRLTLARDPDSELEEDD